ncbi:MAG: hypothetical protein A4E30_00977 [Methanomassiliicoccales archaeon PtaB.Bin215]|nr:MAG: hypothetical protein A4E30_00977 [Methanomassiliicoccales archaeon PtaB.Bin215]
MVQALDRRDDADDRAVNARQTQSGHEGVEELDGDAFQIEGLAFQLLRYVPQQLRRFLQVVPEVGGQSRPLIRLQFPAQDQGVVLQKEEQPLKGGVHVHVHRDVKIVRAYLPLAIRIDSAAPGHVKKDHLRHVHRIRGGELIGAVEQRLGLLLDRTHQPGRGHQPDPVVPQVLRDLLEGHVHALTERLRPFKPIPW